MVVEDASEPGVGDEAAVRSVFVLEERLDQQSPVSDVGADSAHQVVELLLLVGVQIIPWVQDRLHLEVGEALAWALLQILLGENLLNLFIKFEVPHLVGIFWVSVVVLELLVLLHGQLQLLGVESSSELGGIDHTLSEGVVVLQEFSESDSVPLHVLLYFVH